MKALTVRQPWVIAIMHAGKDVENRSRPTKHRGILALHAGVKWETGAEAAVLHLGHLYPLKGPQGAIVGTIEVVDCVQDFRSRWAMPNLWHWILANPKPLPQPIPCKGALGLWNVPEDVAAQIEGAA